MPKRKQNETFQWPWKIGLENWTHFYSLIQKDILSNAGKVTQAIAKAFAESEFEKYRIIQDKNYESDFDKEIKKLKK